jgi:hypothetical protein
MFIRIRIPELAVALIGAGLVLAPRPILAQAPSGADAEQRLRRMEEKIDKLAAVVGELRGGEKRPAPDVPTGIAVLTQARDKFQRELETARKEYEEFRARTPILLFRTAGGSNIYVDRLARIEAKRSELMVKQTELQENLPLVRRVYEKEGKAVALQTLAAMGVKMDLLAFPTLDKLLIELTLAHQMNVQMLGAKHPEVLKLAEQLELVKKLYGKGVGQSEGTAPKPVNEEKPGAARPAELDTVQTLLAAMTAEIERIKLLLAAYDNLFNKEQKDAREFVQMELQDQRLRQKVEAAAKAWEAVDRAVKEVEKQVGPAK